MPEVAIVVGNEHKLDAKFWAEQRDPLRRASFGLDEKKNASSTTSWRCGKPPCTWSTASRAARALSSRCRMAATTAAPSASSRSAAATRARFRWARWSRRCAGWSRTATLEVVLTGVDITSYGADLRARQSSANWCGRSCGTCRSCERLRISSIDSVEADADLLAAIADEPRLMPHLHLSLQAGRRTDAQAHEAAAFACRCDRVLRRGAAPAPGYRVRRRHYRRLPDRDRGDVRALRDSWRNAASPICTSSRSRRGRTPAARMPQLPRRCQGARAQAT